MINKKLIHFNTYSAFEANKSQLYDWTIAFIGETKQIYTHGNFYDCDIEDINELNKILSYHGIKIPTNGIYIHTVDNQLYTENEWDGSTIPNGIGVITSECAFVIALDNISSSKKWDPNVITDSSYQPSGGVLVEGVTTSTDSATVKADFNGKTNTEAIIATLLSSETYAANGCYQFLFPNKEEGYLGSAGEWQAVIDNMAEINSALNKCNAVSLSSEYWTSTQRDAHSAWYVNLEQSSINTTLKNRTFLVRPFAELNLKTIISRIEALESKNMCFSNVSASSWVIDTTYEDYPYKCDISCSGVNSSHYAEVVFDTAEALSGNYAPVCSTGSSIVTIYSKVNDTITIPTIFATLS